MQILQAPIVMAIGFAFGIFWGLICIYVPSTSEVLKPSSKIQITKQSFQKYLITLRTLLLGLGSVLASLGSDAIGYGGAGALGCIVAAFVASFGWRKQGWSFNVKICRINQMF